MTTTFALTSFRHFNKNWGLPGIRVLRYLFPSFTHLTKHFNRCPNSQDFPGHQIQKKRRSYVQTSLSKCVSCRLCKLDVKWIQHTHNYMAWSYNFFSRHIKTTKVFGEVARQNTMTPVVLKLSIPGHPPCCVDARLVYTHCCAGASFKTFPNQMISKLDFEHMNIVRRTVNKEIEREIEREGEKAREKQTPKQQGNKPDEWNSTRIHRIWVATCNAVI